MSLFQKLSYYSLSMWALYLVVFILSFTMPEFNANQTLGEKLKMIAENNVMSMIVLVLFVIDIVLFIYICLYIWKGQTHSPIIIDSSQPRNFDYLSTAMMVLTPLVSFGFIQSPIRSGLVLLAFYLLFAVIYIRGELYYSNFSLILFGIRLFQVSGKAVGGQEKDNIMVFSRQRLKKGDSFSYVRITDDVFYAKKMNV